MDEREKQLRVEKARLERKCVELDSKLKALEPKVARVSYGEKTEAWELTPEKLAEVKSVDKELEEAKAKLKEIEDKLRKHRKQR